MDCSRGCRGNRAAAARGGGPGCGAAPRARRPHHPGLRRGQPGVATSLGAMLGLDWIASRAAVMAFAIVLRASKYVSLSSMVGATIFVIVHLAEVVFLERRSPWGRDHAAFSVLI